MDMDVANIHVNTKNQSEVNETNIRTPVTSLSQQDESILNPLRSSTEMNSSATTKQPENVKISQPTRPKDKIVDVVKENEGSDNVKMNALLVDWYEFEPHYGVSRNSVRDSLKEVLDDMRLHKSIYNWDKKFGTTPFEQLTVALRTYMRQNESLSLNSVLAHTAVEEIMSISGSDHHQSAISQGDNIDGHLLFTKCSSKKGRQILDQLNKRLIPLSNSTTQPNLSPRVIQGRVVFIEEQINFTDRAVLLVLFCLYIRLQNEDPTFIHAFIERHISLRNTFMSPLSWQIMSTPHGDSSRQTFYRRVTLSYHLAYLKFSPISASYADGSDLDRHPLLLRQNQRNTLPNLEISKATTSVLLTIVIPEESKLRQEEANLLKKPQGLWTVLVINCPLRLASNTINESLKHLNPVSQYIRGIACSVNTLRTNAEAVYDDLKTRLDRLDDRSLFDDEEFSKSELFHWTIKICDLVRDTLASSQRYLERVCTKQLKQLYEGAQDGERGGIEVWGTRLEEELYLLAELQSQFDALNSQVQESRNALHGITAVLEARIALQQGHRLKILGYLATIYLPLSASASLYSMAVLPKSATLWSFFIVLTALLISTLVLGLSFRSLITRLRSLTWGTAPKTTNSSSRSRWVLFNVTRILRYVLCPLTFLLSLPIFEKYVKMVTPAKKFPFYWDDVFQIPNEYPGFAGANIWGLTKILKITYVLFRFWPERLVHHALARELLFLRDQYHMFFLLDRSGYYWYPLGLVRDIFRFFMLPVWLGLVILIVVMIMIQDACIGISKFICCR